MRMVSSISYGVVFNEVVGDSFVPSRGLQQRNPLSPYLFLLCREGLSTLSSRVRDAGRLLLLE